MRALDSSRLQALAHRFNSLGKAGEADFSQYDAKPTQKVEAFPHQLCFEGE
jgi:hypothetical protein